MDEQIKDIAYMLKCESKDMVDEWLEGPVLSDIKFLLAKLQSQAEVNLTLSNEVVRYIHEIKNLHAALVYIENKTFTDENLCVEELRNILGRVFYRAHDALKLHKQFIGDLPEEKGNL